MKILIGMTRSDTVISGSFRHICQMGEHFRSLGAEVVYVLGGNGIAAQKLIERGHRVIQLPHLKRSLFLHYDIWVVWQIIRIIAKEKPHICSWHTAKIGALGRIAAAVTRTRSYYVPHGVPFVCTVENTGHRWYAFLERLLAYLPATIIGVCQFDADEYLRIGVNRRKLLVIENGMPVIVPLNNTHKPNSPRRAPPGKILHSITAARFEKQKDFATLANACRRLAVRGYQLRLDIYGDGPDEQHVKTMFMGFHAMDIKFFASVDDFSSRLLQADIFVLSSNWEGLPRSIIEAMSCAMPVVASRVGGCPELIENGVNGYLVDTRDAAGMADAFATYIQNPELIEKHGQASLKKFFSKYTLPSMLYNYTRVYMQTAFSGVLADAKSSTFPDLPYVQDRRVSTRVYRQPDRRRQSPYGGNSVCG